MGYPFGKDFKFYFYPLVDNETVQSIPTQNPDIYIFDDSAGQPSRQAAAAGTGAIQTITDWDKVANGFAISVSALSDPDQTSTITERNYWIAINFKLKAAGQTQTIIRALDMERVAAHEKRVSIEATDLTTLWPEIAQYANNSTLNAAIELAIEEVKSILLNRGFEWATIKRPDRLNLAIRVRALMQIESQQSQESGDNFDRNYQEHKKQYKSYLDSIQLEIDADKDGKPETKTEAAGSAVVCR